MDKYFTPFIVPHKEKRFNTRELKELSTEHNDGLKVVPQLLTNNAEDFLKTSDEIRAMGYDEINLNLGCPSKTVVSKNKGSGFLAHPEELERFLNKIFSESRGAISIKTRLGKESPDEFYHLLKIFNKFPIKELTIHPRIQTDYYKNEPNLDMFEVAYRESVNPLCYNGDLTTAEKIDFFKQRFPNAEAVMIGRGIIQNPGLLTALTKEKLFAFHQEILEEYIQISSGDRNVLFKMKELWYYMMPIFKESEKTMKKIRKCERLIDYENVIKMLFADYDIREEFLK